VVKHHGLQDSLKAGAATRPLQLLALVELEWRLRGVEHLSFVTRTHHSSGVYGVIAPRNVASNFLVAGVRWEF